MGLIDDLAALRLHALVVGVPDRPVLRLRVESAIRRRGWVLAHAPADADLLLVAGEPGEELAAAVDRVWAQVPVPRARRTLRSVDAIEEALDSAARVLGEPALQREAFRAASAEAEGERGAEHEDGQHGHGDEHDMHGDDAVHGHDAEPHGDDMRDMHDHDMPGHDMHAMHGHDMPGHDMHDMQGMSMDGPGGIPLAEGWDGDRDDLEMDVLHLRLGPVLAEWPAGLVVDCTLSGDLVVAATARLLPAADDDGAAPDGADGAVRRFVLGCSAAARLLRVAGWESPALALDRSIGRVLAGRDPAGEVRAVRAVERRVARSAVFRWAVRGAPVDVRGALLAMLRDAVAVPGGGDGADDRPGTASDPDALAASLVGLDFGVCRLVVAAAGLDRVPQQEAVRG